MLSSLPLILVHGIKHHLSQILGFQTIKYFELI
jgi:hypothetical protein